MTIKIVIPGRPVPAVRMTQKGKFTSKQAQRYLAYKDKVGWTAKAQGVKPLKGRVIIDITVFLSGGTEPDWDSLGKGICDGLNKIAYEDDRQIIDGRVRKVLGVPKEDERAVIEIREVG